MSKWFRFALLCFFFLEEVLLCLEFYVVLKKDLFRELPSRIIVDTCKLHVTLLIFKKVGKPIRYTHMI